MAGAVVCVLLAACTADEAPAAQQPVDLRLSQSFHAGPRGVLFIEGAVAEVRATPEQGTVRTVSGSPSEVLVLQDLAPGRYTLSAALRPCEANCGTLGPRLDECRAVVEVPLVREVTIAYVVTESCTITF